MRLRLNLSDVDFQLKISNWVKPDSEDWSADWTDDELVLSSGYINYHVNSELLMRGEVSEWCWTLEHLLAGKLKENETLRFAEPDLSFRIHTAKRLYSVPGKVSYRNGYKDVDISLDMFIRFWCPDGLGGNSFCMTLDRQEIEAMMTYLKVVIGEWPEDAPAVVAQIQKGTILME